MVYIYIYSIYCIYQPFNHNTVFIQNKNLSKCQGIQGFFKWRKHCRNAQNTLWLLKRWDYFVWLWASLWSKGIVSKIPCQALVLIPVSVLFLSTKRTLSQTHLILVTDRGSENWISCERGQENTSRKGKENKDEGLKKYFCLHKTWVVLRVLLIVHNKDLCSLNYRLRACTVWLAMCFALFTATSKSQLLMKNRKKWKEIK